MWHECSTFNSVHDDITKWKHGHLRVYDSILLLLFGTESGLNYWYPLPWRHNGHDNVSYHQPHHCLLNRLCGCRSKETSKLSVTGLCVGNSPVTGEFPAQMASNAENVSIWWRHHDRPLHNSWLFHQLIFPVQNGPYFAEYIFRCISGM